MEVNNRAFLFGYSRRSYYLTRELQRNGFDIVIVVSDSSSYDRAIEDGYLNICGDGYYR